MISFFFPTVVVLLSSSDCLRRIETFFFIGPTKKEMMKRRRLIKAAEERYICAKENALLVYNCEADCRRPAASDGIILLRMLDKSVKDGRVTHRKGNILLFSSQTVKIERDEAGH